LLQWAVLVRLWPLDLDWVKARSLSLVLLSRQDAQEFRLWVRLHLNPEKESEMQAFLNPMPDRILERGLGVSQSLTDPTLEYLG
jgi:hypothetical protein